MQFIEHKCYTLIEVMQVFLVRILSKIWRMKLNPSKSNEAKKVV